MTAKRSRHATRSGRRPRPREDLQRQLNEQFTFLLASCRAYDQGAMHEAKRIAIALRVLLHDTSTSKSILGQLGMKDILFFDNTPLLPPGNLLPTFALVVIPMLQTGPYRFVAPVFDDRLYHDTWMLQFDRWWLEEKVVIVPGQFELSRKDLVLAMANQDGGAHVDPEIDEAYYRLTRENAVGYTVQTKMGSVPILEIETASVRQIGQEVLVSLVRPYREIPRDLPEPTRPPSQVASRDLQGRVTVQTAILGCPCKNGRPYRECHGAPQNAGG